MGQCIGTFGSITAMPSTGKSMQCGGGTISHQRAPSDPYFYANVYIKNAAIGSRWMLGYDNSGTFTQLAIGEAATTDFTIANIPSYASPFLMELRVRKSSSSPKYEPFKTFGYHDPDGLTMYVSQTIDAVAM